ncbi:MAG: hypothetical protein V7731_21090 [Amphritea sp.]
MTDQPKSQAWLINDDYPCTGIIKRSKDGSHERSVEHWMKEGKATPLFAIPEGYQLVPVEPSEKNYGGIKNCNSWSGLS